MPRPYDVPEPPRRARRELETGTASLLAYSLWWISGILFLVVGRDDRDVRFHAAQSTLLFGAVTVGILALNFLATATTGTWLAVLLQIAIWGLLLFGLVAWASCLFLAWRSRGARFDVLLVGDYVRPYAERLADATG